MKFHIGRFEIESYVEWPQYFQNGLGPSREYQYYACGVGETEEDALEDCLEAVVQQDFIVDETVEARIREEYGPMSCLTAREDDEYDGPYFYVCLKWRRREDELLEKIEGDFLRYQGYKPLDSNEIFYGALKPAPRPESAECLEEELFFLLPFSSGSDYSGSTVEKANYRFFLEEFYGRESFVYRVYGDFGTYGIALNLRGLLESERCEEILSLVEGLKDYPLICEETLSLVEAEAADEAWESGGIASDFKKALEEKFGTLEWPPDSLRAFFERKAREVNEYWYNEGGHGPHMNIRLDKIVEAISLDDLADYGVRPSDA